MCFLIADFLRKSLGAGRARSRSRSPRSCTLAETLPRDRAGALRRAAAVERSTSPRRRSRCSVPPLLLQPLVENAVHHGIAHLLEGGEVRISARRRGGALELAVENPCDPERPASRGAGVGLANVRAAARRARSAPARASRSTPEPERFRVAASCCPPTRRPGELNDVTRSMRALIVDDEAPARALLREYLAELRRRRGRRRVRERLRGGQALSSELAPDLLFLDIQMPKLYGFEVLELLGGAAPAVVFVTAYDEYALQAFEVHAVDYLLEAVRAGAAGRGARARAGARLARGRGAVRDAASSPPPRGRPAAPLERVAGARGGPRARPAGRAHRLRRGAGRLPALRLRRAAPEEAADAGRARDAARSRALRPRPPLVRAQRRAPGAPRDATPRTAGWRSSPTASRLPVSRRGYARLKDLLG